jgi:hypothetical protein
MAFSHHALPHVECARRWWRRQRVDERVRAWISRHLHDSNTLRLDMMLFVTVVMLSDDVDHHAYIQERNFSLASMARLRRSFVMNADHLRRLLCLRLASNLWLWSDSGRRAIIWMEKVVQIMKNRVVEGKLVVRPQRSVIGALVCVGRGHLHL